VKSAIPLADLGAGLFAAYGILSAVIGRGITGEGQFVDASLFETAMSLSVWESAEYWGTGEVPVPIGSANRMSAPYQAVRASDRHFVIGAANPKLWNALCTVIGRDDLTKDVRFTDNVLRIRNRAVLIEELEREFVRRTASEWVDALLAAGVPAAPILDYSEALSSEQAVAREMVLKIQHPVEGETHALGFPVKLGGTPQQVRHPAPLLGQHTEQVLGEIGMTPATIEALRQSGAFGAVKSALAEADAPAD